VTVPARVYDGTVTLVGPVSVDAVSVLQFTDIRQTRSVVLVPNETRY